MTQEHGAWSVCDKGVTQEHGLNFRTSAGLCVTKEIAGLCGQRKSVGTQEHGLHFSRNSVLCGQRKSVGTQEHGLNFGLCDKGNQ